MTTLLFETTFAVEPAIDWHIESVLVGMQLAKAGKKRQYSGHGDLVMTLTGSFEGASAYGDRDDIVDLVKLGGKVLFYSDTINYGSSGAPKSVWVKSFECHQPEGIPQYLEFIITIVEETA